MLVPDLRWETCYQIALAIKDEVEDLERAGITVIQIDEAALRGVCRLGSLSRLPIWNGLFTPSGSLTAVLKTLPRLNVHLESEVVYALKLKETMILRQVTTTLPC